MKIMLVVIVLVAIVVPVSIFLLAGQQTTSEPPLTDSGGAITTPDVKLDLCSNSDYSTEYNHWTGKIGLTADSIIKLRDELEQKGDSALDGISDLTCLQVFKADELRSAFIEPISSVSAVRGLVNLENLSFSNQDISDIQPLMNLKNLIHLDLSENSISDIQPLMNLKNLIHLGLSRNSISDISVIAHLTKLKDLIIADNKISDLSPLGGLVNLERLIIGQNEISDISAISNLKNLERLNLEENPIRDFSPLSSLKKLRMLNLARSYFSDISVLRGLTELVVLDLPLTNLTSNECDELRREFPNTQITCSAYSQDPIKQKRERDCRSTECETDTDCFTICGVGAKCLGAMTLGSSIVFGRCSPGESLGDSPSGGGLPPGIAPSAVICGDGRCSISLGESCKDCPQDCNPCDCTYDEEMLSFYVDMELQPLLSALQDKISQEACHGAGVLNTRNYYEVAVDVYHQEVVDQLNDNYDAQVDPKWCLLRADHTFSCGQSTEYSISFVVDLITYQVASKAWGVSRKPKYDNIVKEFNEGKLV
jgi:hypothetical protein